MAKPWEQLDEWDRANHLNGIARSIKVSGAQHHPDIQDILCSGCEHGLVYLQRSGNGGPTVLCLLTKSRPERPADIEECTAYDPKAETAVTMEDMAKIALTIDPRDGPPNKHTYL